MLGRTLRNKIPGYGKGCIFQHTQSAKAYRVFDQSPDSVERAWICHIRKMFLDLKCRFSVERLPQGAFDAPYVE